MDKLYKHLVAYKLTFININLEHNNMYDMYEY